MLYKYLRNSSGNSLTIILVVFILISVSFNIYLFSSANSKLEKLNSQASSGSSLIDKKIKALSVNNKELTAQQAVSDEKIASLQSELLEAQTMLEQAQQEITAKKEMLSSQQKDVTKPSSETSSETKASAETKASTEVETSLPERSEGSQKVSQPKAIAQQVPESKLQEYADQVKELANIQIEHYQTFKDHTTYVKTLKKQISDLETKVEDLNNDKEILKKQLLEKEEESSSQDMVIQGELTKQKISFLYQLALLSIENMLFDKAINYFKQITNLSPEDANAYYNLAIINDQVLENSSNALSFYKKYVSLSPDSEDIEHIKNRIKTLSQVT